MLQGIAETHKGIFYVSVIAISSVCGGCLDIKRR
jgi:hypothetical protein